MSKWKAQLEGLTVGAVLASLVAAFVFAAVTRVAPFDRPAISAAAPGSTAPASPSPSALPATSTTTKAPHEVRTVVSQGTASKRMANHDASAAAGVPTTPTPQPLTHASSDPVTYVADNPMENWTNVGGGVQASFDNYSKVAHVHTSAVDGAIGGTALEGPMYTGGC